ncbi:hypothetical protein EJB05_26280, partial [Eragrostis curvula]
MAPRWIGELASLEELQVCVNWFVGNDARVFLKALASLTELRVLNLRIDKQMKGSLSTTSESFLCTFDNWVPHLSFNLLRVLAIESCKNVSSTHLVHLGNLLHLRYLGLENTQVGDLPIDVGALRLLQTLNLGKTGIKQLTANISRLTQLVCLKGDLNCTMSPNWIGKLSSLEELQLSIICFKGSEDDHARGFLQALGSLRKLRKLRFCEMPGSMIQLQCKEDSSISFHIWNGIGAIPFGSRKNDSRVPPYAVMPNLEVLRARIFVRALKDDSGKCGNVELWYLTSLRKLEMLINCEGASSLEVDEAEAALRNATEVHPNHPTLIPEEMSSQVDPNTASCGYSIYVDTCKCYCSCSTPPSRPVVAHQVSDALPSSPKRFSCQWTSRKHGCRSIPRQQAYAAAVCAQAA